MSSDDDLHDIDDGIGDFGQSLGSNDPKRRKILRACDVCRRKKIRCDAHSQQNTRCTHCATYKLECTFNEGTKKRGPPKGYIDDLERRCEALERLVNRVAPHINVEDEVGPKFTKDTWASIKGNSTGRGSRTHATLKAVLSPTSGNTLPPSPEPRLAYLPLKHQEGLPQDSATTLSCLTGPTSDITSALDSDDERNFPDGAGGLTKYGDIAKRGIESQLENLNLTGFEKRFHGKSSGVTLVQVAMNLKEEVEGNLPVTVNFKRQFKMRPQFWKPCPWEWVTNPHAPSITQLKFPPDDLGAELVRLCFEKVMILYPIVHRPLFERQLKAGLHHRDMNFARVYLLLCAVGSRWSEDDRVALKNAEGEVEWASAGWGFFSQVMQIKRPILAPAGLSDLQVTALSALYLQGTSAPHAAWLIVGIGLRFAQDIGAHREKVYGGDHPFENQMWKRAFWSLVAMDRMTSAGLGRPMAVFDEDIDVDLPLEVDDEYYDEVKQEWKQPPGKPSHITAFNQLVKLQGILAYAIRTVYSINKSKAHLGFVGQEWEAHTVAELDSALNAWQDSLPDHLKWDPNIQDQAHFEQAAMLRLTYHYVQITIHRPFIPVLSTAGKASPLSFPSLAICTNAARSASHILEVRTNRGEETSPGAFVIAFTAGTVLLISIWGIKKNGLNVDVTSQIADVHRCIKALKNVEKRWQTAGRLCDILTELASVGDVPIPQNTPTPPDSTRKRDREDEDEVPSPVPAAIKGKSITYPGPFASPASSASSASAPRRAASNPVVPTSIPGSVPYSQVFPQSQPGPAPQQPTTSFGSAMDMAGGDSLLSGQWNVFASSNWDNYHIGGADVPGMNPSLSRINGLGVPTGPEPAVDLMSPTSLFQELLGSFGNPGDGAVPTAQPMEGISLDGYANFNWMNDIGLSGMMPNTNYNTQSHAP